MRYTYVIQHDATDCAAACLAKVCLHYKKETTITKLRDMMGTDLKGTNMLRLDKCTSSLEFVTQAVRVDREGFLSKYTLPAIATLNGSNINAELAIAALQKALDVHKPGKGIILHSDQGSQYTSKEFNEFC